MSHTQHSSGGFRVQQSSQAADEGLSRQENPQPLDARSQSINYKINCVLDGAPLSVIRTLQAAGSILSGPISLHARCSQLVLTSSSPVKVACQSTECLPAQNICRWSVRLAAHLAALTSTALARVHASQITSMAAGELEMSSCAASRHKRQKVGSAGSHNGAAQGPDSSRSPDSDSAKHGSASDHSSHATGVPVCAVHVLSWPPRGVCQWSISCSGLTTS